MSGSEITQLLVACVVVMSAFCSIYTADGVMVCTTTLTSGHLPPLQLLPTTSIHCWLISLIFLNIGIQMLLKVFYAMDNLNIYFHVHFPEDLYISQSVIGVQAIADMRKSFQMPPLGNALDRTFPPPPKLTD